MDFNVNQSSEIEVNKQTQPSENVTNPSLFGDEVLFEGLEISSISTNESTDVSIDVYFDSLKKRLDRYEDEYKSVDDLIDIEKNSKNDQETTVNKVMRQIDTSCINDVLQRNKIEAKMAVQTPYGEFTLFVPTIENTDMYLKCFARVITKTIQSVKTLNSVLQKRPADIVRYQKHFEDLSFELLKQHALNPSRKRVVTILLQALFWEKLRDKLLNRVEALYGSKEIYLDESTQGLWISNNNDESIPASKRKVLVPKYKLDDQQTQWLVKLVFSPKPREKAAAKLNLFSKVKDSIIQDIKSKSAKVLAQTLSEIDLSQDEVLAVLFTDIRNEQSQCPNCGTQLELDNAIYHRRCPVMDWLVEHFFFKFDEEKGLLMRQKMMYLDKSQRAVLEIIEKRTAQLHQPFQLRRQGKYAQMRPTPEGFKTVYEFTTPQYYPKPMSQTYNVGK
uniref:KIAA0141 protein n=1 Tax=Fopius arisanus TaxID=64838 RepID=A0A0C9REU8_9HYME